jgi:hypothetical protein
VAVDLGADQEAGCRHRLSVVVETIDDMLEVIADAADLRMSHARDHLGSLLLNHRAVPAGPGGVDVQILWQPCW